MLETIWTWLFLHHKDLLFLHIKILVLFNECTVHIIDLAIAIYV